MLLEGEGSASARARAGRAVPCLDESVVERRTLVLGTISFARVLAAILGPPLPIVILSRTL